MNKLDLSDSFCHILVCCDDWELPESSRQVEINGTLTTAYFVYVYLPLGLHSFPALFLKYVDILSFTVHDHGASTVWNYLDISRPAARLNQTFAKGTWTSFCILLQNWASIPILQTFLLCTILELLGIELASITQGANFTSASDTLSCLPFQRFRRLVPDADLKPTPVFPLNLADFKWKLPI